MNVKDVNLTPAELQAILDHKRSMSLAHGVEVSLEEAIEHFIEHYELDWMREKQRRDLAEQRHEIEKHKYLRSEKEGRDIGKARAAEEWCAKYAPIWRAEHESLERNGFLKVSVVIQSEQGLHMQPASTLANLAQQYSCEVYLHRVGMEYFNFILQGKKYLNVKSVLCLLTVKAEKGESLEFIATGPQAKTVLETIAGYIGQGTEPQKVEAVPGVA
ncbi:MAG: HPr family phosphocarrier protein [Kiritimatiellaeota bacterium]|nr:HPr family phosphocarrier protein [Kiritimatiellota bacterium]